MAGERIEYDNQFTTAFELLESYRDILRTALSRAGLSCDSVDYVSKRFCADKGLIFSLQPAYQPSNLPFHEFCRKVGFAEHIMSAMRERFWRNFHLFRHQEEAISAILDGIPTVLATGTGSGKTESFLLPILNHCLKTNAPGIKSILLYPMNALANDQIDRLSRYASNSKITFGILTGATPEDPPEDAEYPENHIISRREMRETPPDILLTNYVMLERLLTARKWRPIIDGCRDSLAYLVLDELHTYRGTKATHLMFLLKRLREQTETCPLLIGASATLAQEGGYISGTTFDQDALDDFLRSVLDVEEYRLVTPDYEVEQTEPMAWPTISSIPDHEIRDSADSLEKCRLLGDLLGERVPVSFWLSDEPFWTSDIGGRLNRHPFLVELTHSLQESGAKTFAEITNLYKELCPREISGEQAALTVKAWLNALSIIATDFSDERPALDLRLHVFLRGLTGFLHRCLSCGSFHPDGSDICPECGSPLFLVDREDVHACVAKVRERALSAVLDHEEDDGPDTFFVKVWHLKHAENSDTPNGIRCTQAVGIGAESIPRENVILPFTHALEGELQLAKHDIQSFQEIKKRRIFLADPIHPREHLRNLVLAILQQLPQKERRLLGFIDDRERASHDSMAISDELVSRFFEVILASIAPEIGPRLSIDQALDAIKAYVIDLVEEDMLDDVGKNVFEEIELWFFRLIGEPVRFAPSRSGLLAVRDLDEYAELEQQVLELFLRERAINFRCQNPMSESRYIKFQKHWALNKRQIYCDPAARPETQKETKCISLSPNSKEYIEFILQVGEKCEDFEDPELASEQEIKRLQKKAGSDAILRAIESLAEKGVIYRTSETAPCRYSLNPEHVLLCISEDSEEMPDRHPSYRHKSSLHFSTKVFRTNL
ncbi:MAG: hypothetical protein C4B58_12530 [Deltaproteobacteria bacterium]|nr:MAG: hypothetical protein C4B58_12530 [Deltaproteobacteria bacterium]